MVICYSLILFSFLNSYGLSEPDDKYDWEVCEERFSKFDNCTYFHFRSPSPQVIDRCQWYSNNSCCIQADLDKAFARFIELPNANPDCKTTLMYLACYICSPLQYKFFKNERLYICLDFCDRLYSHCSEAVFAGYKIGQKYSDGRSFCESRLFIVRDESGSVEDRSCFTEEENRMPIKTSYFSNQAAYLQSSALLIEFCAIAIVFSLFSSNVESLFLEDHRLPGYSPPKKSLAKSVSNSQVIKINGNAHCKLMRCIFVFINLFPIPINAIMEETVIETFASRLSQNILPYAETVMKSEEIQRVFDEAHYKYHMTNGTRTIQEIKKKMEEFFSTKVKIVQRTVEHIQTLHDEYLPTNRYKHVDELTVHVFRDTSFPERYMKYYPLKYNNKYRRNVNANGSVYIMPYMQSRSDKKLVDMVLWTHQAEKKFIANSQSDDDIMWQYFSSNKVLITCFYPMIPPTINYMGFPLQPTPRLRPWYLTASRIKNDVVIILDASLSMEQFGRLPLAKLLISEILNLVTSVDKISIITSQGSYVNTHGDVVKLKHSQPLSCSEATEVMHLVEGTEYNKKRLLKALKTVTGKGSSVFNLDAFTSALDILKKSQGVGSCSQLIIFITDAEKHDGNGLMCTIGEHGEVVLLKTSFKVCSYQWERFSGQLKNLMGEKDISPELFTFIVKNRGGVPTGFLCSGLLHTFQINEESDLKSNLKELNFRMNIAKTRSNQTKVSVTEPYLDLGGLGLIITLSAPVFSKKSNELLGVFGLDISLTSLKNILLHNWRKSYGFLTDFYGNAVLHPGQAAHRIIGGEVFGQPLKLLEISPEQVEHGQLLDNKLKELNKNEVIDFRIYNILRPMHGRYSTTWRSVQYVHYFLTYVKNPSFILGVVLSDAEEHFYYALHTRRALQEVRVCSQKNDSKSSEERSCVVIGYDAFCSLGHYFRASSEELSRYLKQKGSESLVCPNATLQDFTWHHLHLTNSLDEVWRNASGYNASDIARIIYCTDQGFHRVFPESKVPEYILDRFTRMGTRELRYRWWLQAISNKGQQLTVTSVTSDDYSSDKSLGKIVTLAKVIFRGDNKHRFSIDSCYNKPYGTSCPCTYSSDCISHACLPCSAGFRSRYLGSVDSQPTCNRQRFCKDDVEGVVAVDVKYEAFKKLKENAQKQIVGFKCEERCYIIDGNTHIVVGGDLDQIPSYHRNIYEERSVSSYEGFAFRDLMLKRIISQQSTFRQKKECTHSARCNLDLLFHVAATRNVKMKLPVKTCSVRRIYYVVDAGIMKDLTVTGSLEDDPCSGTGTYYFAKVPDLALYVLKVNVTNPKKHFDFNCHIMKSVFIFGDFEEASEFCMGLVSPIISPGEVTDSCGSNKVNEVNQFHENCVYNRALCRSPSSTGALLALCVVQCLEKLQVKSVV